MVDSIGMRRGLIIPGDRSDGLERQGSNPWSTTKIKLDFVVDIVYNLYCIFPGMKYNNLCTMPFFLPTIQITWPVYRQLVRTSVLMYCAKTTTNAW